MKKGTIIGIIVGAIVLVILVVGVVGYIFFNDVIQKSKIVEELSQIEEITKTGEFDIEELNEKTSRIVTNGKYANIEKAAKNYASDLFHKAYEIRTTLQDEKMTQILTASNYEEDGPGFIETKKYLSETKQKLEEGKAEMLSYIEESKINSYIEAETEDKYCIELYKQLLTKDINMSETEKNELEKSIDKVISMLDIESEVVDFLIENTGNWELQGDQILFNANSLVIEYNAFLTKLRIL